MSPIVLCNKKVVPVLLKSSCAAVTEDTSVCSLSLTLDNMASVSMSECLPCTPSVILASEVPAGNVARAGNCVWTLLVKVCASQSHTQDCWLVQMIWTTAWLCALDQPYLLVKAHLTHKSHKTKHWSSFPETLKAWDKCFCSSNVFNRIISFQQFKHVAPISGGLQRWHSAGLESKIYSFTKIMKRQNLKILCLHNSYFVSQVL